MRWKSHHKCFVCDKRCETELTTRNDQNCLAFHVSKHFSTEWRDAEWYYLYCPCGLEIKEVLGAGTLELQRHFYTHTPDEMEALCALRSLGKS